MVEFLEKLPKELLNKIFLHLEHPMATIYKEAPVKKLRVRERKLICRHIGGNMFCLELSPSHVYF